MLFIDEGKTYSYENRALLPKGDYPVVKIPEEESCFLSNCRIKETQYTDICEDEPILSLKELYEEGVL